MKTISQIARFRQSVVSYSFKFGVSAAVRRFNVSRASVYRWKTRLPFVAAFKERHKLIRPYTPRHNGKVERSHRKDNEYFYATHKFYSFEDFKAQLAIHNRKYNAFPMRPLNWHSPKDYITDYLRDGLLH